MGSFNSAPQEEEEQGQLPFATANKQQELFESLFEVNDQDELIDALVAPVADELKQIQKHATTTVNTLKGRVNELANSATRTNESLLKDNDNAFEKLEAQILVFTQKKQAFLQENAAYVLQTIPLDQQIQAAITNGQLTALKKEHAKLLLAEEKLLNDQRELLEKQYDKLAPQRQKIKKMKTGITNNVATLGRNNAKKKVVNEKVNRRITRINQITKTNTKVVTKKTQQVTNLQKKLETKEDSIGVIHINNKDTPYFINVALSFQEIYTLLQEDCNKKNKERMVLTMNGIRINLTNFYDPEDETDIYLKPMWQQKLSNLYKNGNFNSPITITFE